MPADHRFETLPLPLAQLYRRAENAKTPLERHLAGYYLWEATVKLLAAIAAIECHEHSPHDERLAPYLHALAKPSMGHWWGLVKTATKVLAAAGQEEYVRLLSAGELERDDLPLAAGLELALADVLPAETRPTGKTVQLVRLFDRLVQYRNREIAHGAVGIRDRKHHERMAKAFLGGMRSVLDQFDILRERCLLFVTDVHRSEDGDWIVEYLELLGNDARRAPPVHLPSSLAASLPQTDGVYMQLTRRGGDQVLSLSPNRLLSPLVAFDEPANHFYFLNAQRGKQSAELLCYTSGDDKRTLLSGDHRRFLADILGQEVNETELHDWADAAEAAEAARGAAPLATAEFEPRLLGEFELISVLGVGGMGKVYRARQPTLGREVALKRLLRTGDEFALQRFTREIRVLGRIDHPNVVKVFTSGSDGDEYFFAMELIEGADLARVCRQLTGGGNECGFDETDWKHAVSTAVEQARREEFSLSGSSSDVAVTASDSMAIAGTAEANEVFDAAQRVRGGTHYVSAVIDVVKQVVEALAALHSAGVIHRDVKPGNVMITTEGQAVLMDLGLAQISDEAQISDQRLTATRQFVGTLRYASPEQILAVGFVDERTDIYGLGALFWELLTLQPLFAATDEVSPPELMRRIQWTEPVWPRRVNPQVPRDVEAIVLKCLEKNPNRRYQTARELSADLDRWQRGEPVLAQPQTWRYLLRKQWHRHRLRIAGLSVAAALLVGLAITTSVVSHRTALKRENDLQAERLLQELLVAEIDDVQDLSKELNRFRPRIEPKLRHIIDAPGSNDDVRLRGRLALLQWDDTQRDALTVHMLAAAPSQFAVICSALHHDSALLINRLWKAIDDEDSAIRFRAAAALAEFDRSNPRWAALAPSVVNQLVHYDPATVRAWKDAFRPVESKLRESLLEVCRDERPESRHPRLQATEVLADYVSAEPEWLTRLILEADETQFSLLSPYLRHHRIRIKELLSESLTGLPSIGTMQDDSPSAYRLANALVALLRMEHANQVWEYLAENRDPDVRCFFIHRVKPFGCSPDSLADRLLAEASLENQRTLLLGLGEYDFDQIRPEIWEQLMPWLERHFVSTADSGRHSAIAWLLTNWGKADMLDAWRANAASSTAVEPTRKWRLNSQMQTLVRIEGAHFMMGSPQDEPGREGGEGSAAEQQHGVNLTYPFWIGATEVTFSEYCRFRAEHQHTQRYAVHDRDPANSVTWHQAVEYCNWLSEQEGLDRCYDHEQHTDGNSTLVLREDWRNCTGYRLPFEAEWEYACRAGTQTSRFFGNSTAYLPRYVYWKHLNDAELWTVPAGMFKPNGFGLFDTLGNVAEWCGDRYREFRPDGTEMGLIEKSRVIRGGSFRYQASLLRSAHRTWDDPMYASPYVGFRLVQSIGAPVD